MNRVEDHRRLWFSERLDSFMMYAIIMNVRILNNLFSKFPIQLETLRSDPMKPTYEALDETTEKILKKIHPMAIILFSSLLKGNASENSDIDLLVVWDEKKKKKKNLSNIKHAIEVRDAIGLVDYALDILTCTTEELIQGTANSRSFTSQIIKEEEILYGRLH